MLFSWIGGGTNATSNRSGNRWRTCCTVARPRIITDGSTTLSTIPSLPSGTPWKHVLCLVVLLLLSYNRQETFSRIAPRLLPLPLFSWGENGFGSWVRNICYRNENVFRCVWTGVVVVFQTSLFGPNVSLRRCFRRNSTAVYGFRRFRTKEPNRNLFSRPWRFVLAQFALLKKHQTTQNYSLKDRLLYPNQQHLFIMQVRK